MTPQLPPIDSYVKPIQILGHFSNQEYVGQICKVIGHNGTGNDTFGEIFCKFEDGKELSVYEWESVPLKTASAVLTAGNDDQLKWLRIELKNAEYDIERETERLKIYEDRLANAKWRESTILDLIAARMDQLKGNQN